MDHSMYFSTVVVLLIPLICPVSLQRASYTKIQDNDLCNISSCNSTDVPETSELYRVCQEGPYFLKGRCCYRNDTRTILGLDLSHCVIMDLSILTGEHNATEGFDKRTLEIISLEDNPLSDCDGSAFNGMTSLTYVSLPSICTCPFGDHAWDIVNHTSNETVCHGDKCRKSGVECPKNSHCEVQSVGVYWCVCDEGYYGYKCLRTGTFQYIPFIAGTVGGTIGFSALVWVLSRRKARKVD